MPQETPQHYDGQSVIPKPQVRGQGLKDAGAHSDGFPIFWCFPAVPGFLAMCKLLSLPHWTLFLVSFHTKCWQWGKDCVLLLSPACL